MKNHKPEWCTHDEIIDGLRNLKNLKRIAFTDDEYPEFCDCGVFHSFSCRNSKMEQEAKKYAITFPRLEIIRLEQVSFVIRRGDSIEITRNEKDGFDWEHHIIGLDRPYKVEFTLGQGSPAPSVWEQPS